MIGKRDLTLVSLQIFLLLTVLMTACERAQDRSGAAVPAVQEQASSPLEQASSEPAVQIVADEFAPQRATMVSEQLAGRDIVNERVLDVMRRVPRHAFVPQARRHQAYVDSPLPIGSGQTISQPYIVALMTQLVDPQPHHKALDIGTGSGYQAAVLAELVKSVHSIEIVESLAKQARQRLQTMDYQNINVRHGDGYHGWESEAPFDIIIVAAAPDHVPPALVEQLAPGGKLVIPVGAYFQTLLVIEKKLDGTVVQNEVAPVAFVPMTGAARE